MVRSRSSVFALALPAIGLMVACSSAPEQQLLQKYFQASRMRDNTTLANIATVSFSPTEQGTVQSFSVATPEAQEERRPLNLKELAAAEEAARKEDEEFNKKKKEYQDANRQAIDRVLAAEAANKSVARGDVAVQEAWRKWRDDSAVYSKKLAEARQALSHERAMVDPSVYDARNPVDATKFDGELITKDLTLKAKVKTPDGATVDKDLHVRVTRADLTGGPDGKAVSGRWIITHVSEAHPAGS